MGEGPLKRSALRRLEAELPVDSSARSPDEAVAGIVQVRAYLGDLRFVAARRGADVVDRARGKPEFVFDEGHYLIAGYGAPLCFAGKSDDAFAAFAVELDGYVRVRG